MSTALTHYLDARPTLEVADLSAALHFWTDVVGFEATVVMGEPPNFAILQGADASLGLFEVAAPAALQSAPVFITCTGLDLLVERLAQAGVALDSPPTIRPWNLRDLVVRCPGGGPLLAFGEAVAS